MPTRVIIWKEPSSRRIIYWETPDYLIVAIFKFRPNSTHCSHTHSVLSLSCSWRHQQSGRRQRSGWRWRSVVAIHTAAVYSHVTSAVRWNSTRIRRWSPTIVGFIARTPSNADGVGRSGAKPKIFVWGGRFVLLIY